MVNTDAVLCPPVDRRLGSSRSSDVNVDGEKSGSSRRFRSENLKEGLVGVDSAVLGRGEGRCELLEGRGGGNKDKGAMGSSGEISLETWDCNDFLASADIRREDGPKVLIGFTVENAGKSGELQR
jgi:hypothetical protein